jgi:hypothetical protein
MVLAFSMDVMQNGLTDAKALGPSSTTSKTFDVQYSISPSIAADPSAVVQLYWEDRSDWLGPVWNYYGTDPTPGDGHFTVDASKMDGDRIYGWFIRVKNGAFNSDNSPPGLWRDPEATTRVNYLPPVNVSQYLPEAPNPGNSVTLHWQESDDSSFASYFGVLQFVVVFRSESKHLCGKCFSSISNLCSSLGIKLWNTVLFCCSNQ